MCKVSELYREAVRAGKDRLDLRDDLLRMQAGQTISLIDIAGLDRGDDLLMLVDELLRQAIAIGLVIETQETAPLVQQPVEQGQEIRVAPRLAIAA